MNFQKLIINNNLNTLEKLQEFFKDEPYNVIVKGNDTRAIAIANKYKTTNKFMKEADGCVIDIPHMKIICFTPYFERVEVTKESKFDDQKQNEIIVEELIDGTMIRIYYDEEWKIATMHTYDAQNAYWFSSKSFKELFLECAENLLDFETLNKSYVYGFIIRHPENKYVTHYQSKDLVHIFTFDKEKDFQFVDVNLQIPNSEYHIIKPKTLKFKTFNEMIDSCLNLMFYNPGYLYTDSDGNKIKYISPHYTHVKNLKGNIQKMDVRYLQIRKTPVINELLTYYPEFLPLVQSIEQKIIQKVNELHKKYVDIKIRKQWYDLDKIEKQILYNLHAIYLQDKVPINFQTVYNYFNSLPYYKIAMTLDIPLNNNKN